MVQDRFEHARQHFEYVAKVEPKDELGAQFAKALTAPSEAPTAVATNPARATDTAETHQPSPPAASLLGTWKAKPMPDLSIELTLREDGQFTWDLNTNGHVDSITSDADYLEGVLTLTQADAPALVGKVVNIGDKQFGFEGCGQESWRWSRESQDVTAWRGDDEGGTSGPACSLTIRNESTPPHPRAPNEARSGRAERSQIDRAERSPFPAPNEWS
jgi:hypothetical protein